MRNYYIRSSVKPGITGLAQVRGFRGETRTEEDIVRRVESDISYLETWSFSLDCVIIARTLWQMLFPPRSAR
jgi:putative colanic acid biosynthesis UDP-glucose lipid carrier transferase